MVQIYLIYSNPGKSHAFSTVGKILENTKLSGNLPIRFFGNYQAIEILLGQHLEVKNLVKPLTSGVYCPLRLWTECKYSNYYSR